MTEKHENQETTTMQDHSDRLDYRHEEQKKALLIAMFHGGTVSRATRVRDAPFRVTVKGDSATVPAGIIHEMSQERLLRKQDYPDRFFYTLTEKGRSLARRIMADEK